MADQVRLVIPAAPEHVLLARLTVAGLASRLGFDYEDIDDLKIVVNEMCEAFVGPASRDGTVEILWTLEDEALVIEAVAHTRPPAPLPDGDDLALEIIRSLSDDLVVSPGPDGSPPSIRAVKRRRA